MVLNKSKYTSGLFGLFILLISLTTGSSLLAMDIVRNGKATSVIVIPNNAWPVVKYAARELQYHIERATGAKLPIVTESEKPTNITNIIYIGNCKETIKQIGTSKSLSPNAFTSKLVDNKLFLFGHDSPGNPLGVLHGNNTLCGSLFAVYDFLEKTLHVLWLWPGRLGEVIPKTSSISISSMNYTWIPKLLHTRLRDYGRQGHYSKGWASKKAAQQYFHDQSVWMRRHRFRRGISLEYGHAFVNYWKRFGKTHPEYFNLLPNGKRQADPLYWGGDDKLISMSVAEPGLWKQIISDWQKTRTKFRPWINCCENDTQGKCICKKCLLWDVHNPNETVSIEKAKQAFLKGDKNWWKYLGSLSDRYARFYLAVQKQAQKIDPNATVIAYAYSNRKEPPIKTKLNKRIVIGIVPELMFPWTKAKRQAFRKQWQGWYDTGAKLYLRPNYFWCGHNMPIFFADKFGEDFQYAFKRGMFATDFDSLVGNWATQGPNLYMLGEIQTHPERSVKDILDEYYSGFGKAKKCVRAYFEYWKRISDAVTDDIINKAMKQKAPEGGGFSRFHRIASVIFTPSVMAKGRALLEKAKIAAKGDSIAEKRVEFLDEGLRNAELTLAVQSAYEQYKKTGDLEPYRRAIRELDAFRAKVEKDNIANMGVLAQFEAYTWPRGSMLNVLDQPPLTGQWKFMWDPNNIGLSEGWQSINFDDSKWFNIRVDAPWEKQTVGKVWKKEHGKDYDGVAWYRIRFSVKSDTKHKCYRLVFGAVDEACNVWLNDQHILDRPYPYKGDPDSWKQPFAIDVTNVIRKGSPNLLAVRVIDRAGAGGIWKPVWLTESDMPVDEANNAIPNGGFEKGKAKWSVNTMCGQFRYDIDRNVHHSGTASARITCLKLEAKPTQRCTAWGRWYQTKVSVKRGKTYRMRVWVKTSKNFTGKIHIWFRSGRGKPEANQSTVLLTTGGIWKEVILKNIIPASDNAAIYLNLMAGTGTAWFDDVELTEASNP